MYVCVSSCLSLLISATSWQLLTKRLIDVAACQCSKQINVGIPIYIYMIAHCMSSMEI